MIENVTPPQESDLPALNTIPIYIDGKHFISLNDIHEPSRQINIDLKTISEHILNILNKRG